MKKQREEQYKQKQFDKDVKKIAAWAKRVGVKKVYGKPRGGLTLAVRLSYLLDIPLIMDEKKITKRTLVVDEIVDGGKTMRKLFNSLKRRGVKPLMASIYFSASGGSLGAESSGRTSVLGGKEGAKFTPDFYLHEKKNKRIKFPWEV